MGAFEELCEIAERNGLVVEIPRRKDGMSAIWVLPDPLFDKQFEVAGAPATMRRAVVASPFWIGRTTPAGTAITAESSAPQLIEMLAARGFD